MWVYRLSTLIDFYTLDDSRHCSVHGVFSERGSTTRHTSRIRKSPRTSNLLRVTRPQHWFQPLGIVLVGSTPRIVNTLIRVLQGDTNISGTNTGLYLIGSPECIAGIHRHTFKPALNKICLRKELVPNVLSTNSRLKFDMPSGNLPGSLQRFRIYTCPRVYIPGLQLFTGINLMLPDPLQRAGNLATTRIGEMRYRDVAYTPRIQPSLNKSAIRGVTQPTQSTVNSCPVRSPAGNQIGGTLHELTDRAGARHPDTQPSIQPSGFHNFTALIGPVKTPFETNQRTIMLTANNRFSNYFTGLFGTSGV